MLPCYSKDLFMVYEVHPMDYALGDASLEISHESVPTNFKNHVIISRFN